MGEREQIQVNSDAEVLRRYCLHIVRFVSTIAMDPHLYFEKKLSAELEALKSVDQLANKLDELIDWVDSTGMSSGQNRQLDEQLAVDGLPGFSRIRESADRRALLAQLNDG